jgi:molybdenum cofactor cytidylyltransferase
LLSQTLKNAVQTGLRVVVVTSENLAGAVRDTVAVRDIIVMPELDEKGHPSPVGMGHSIAAGVAATCDAEGWLIVPADMPMLRASSILRVAEGLEQYPISFAQYKGRRGHPVGFNAELFSELIARYPSQGLEVDDPGVLLDIDTTEDLARLRASSASSSSALPD